MMAADLRELIAKWRSDSTCYTDDFYAGQVAGRKQCADELAAVLASPGVGGPIPLSDEQLNTAKEWAADNRLWTTQETVEINLRTFARKILALASPGVPAGRGNELIATIIYNRGTERIECIKAAPTTGPATPEGRENPDEK